MMVLISTFLLGVVLTQFFSALPSMMVVLVMVLVAGLATICSLTRPLAGLLAGIVYSTLWAAWLLADVVPTQLNRLDVAATVQVSAVRVLDAKSKLLTLQIIDLQLPDAHYRPHKVRIGWYRSAPPIKPGERWRLKLRLKPIHSWRNPGTKDREKNAFRQGIQATGYVLEDPDNRRLQKAAPGFLDRWREEVGRVITAASDQAVAPLIQALALGDRSEIGTEDWRILQRTGTSHLMAISGLHVGLAALFGYLVGSLLARILFPLLLYIPAQIVGAGTGLLFATAYAALAGFSIPTLRALTMLVLIFFYRVLRRHGSARQLLQMTLFLVLLMDPLAVLYAGFWLSFAAVALIVVMLERQYDSDQATNSRVLSRLKRYGSDLLSIQWLLSLGLIPLSLLFFGAVSVLSPLANFLAVPVVSLLVVPAALAGDLLVLSGFTDLASASFTLAAQILVPLWQFLYWLSEQPWALWELPALQPWQLFLIATGLLWLLLPLNPRRWLGLPWVVLPLLWQPLKPGPGELWLTVLDVGQGLAVVLRTRRHALLYDAGPRYFGLDAGRSVVVPYLRSQGIKRLDLLIASHSDTDHVGGVGSVRAVFSTRHFFGSASMRFPLSRPCVAGQKFVFDGVSIEILGPPADEIGSDNDSSCVLRISGKTGSVLLLGDVSARREHWLVKRYGKKLRSTVIVAPHHGSRSSSSTALLGAVRPTVNIFSAGFHSRYQHPHPQIVRRYREYGVRSYNTASSGAVTIRLSEKGLTVTEYRKQHQHYWNR